MNEKNSAGAAGRRFPPWLKKRLPLGGRVDSVRDMLAGLRLATVCQSAHCPNLHECFHAGTATFMILGDSCTRACRFCAVRHEGGQPLDPDEPERVAEAAVRLGLKYVVITSVTRDDLADGGAGHFRDTVLAVRRRGGAQAEVLTPDFQGDMEAVDCVASARPTVYNHNVETVSRLYPHVRPEADYERSLAVLRRVAKRHDGVRVKSGLMVGLGETRDELRAVMRDLLAAGCTVLTIGQYLQPSAGQLPVERYVEPEEFESYKQEGLSLGFDVVASGPFVRSSYHAGGIMDQIAIEHGRSE